MSPNPRQVPLLPCTVDLDSVWSEYLNIAGSLTHEKRIKLQTKLAELRQKAAALEERLGGKVEPPAGARPFLEDYAARIGDLASREDLLLILRRRFPIEASPPSHQRPKSHVPAAAQPKAEPKPETSSPAPTPGEDKSGDARVEEGTDVATVEQIVSVLDSDGLTVREVMLALVQLSPPVRTSPKLLARPLNDGITEGKIGSTGERRGKRYSLPNKE